MFSRTKSLAKSLSLDCVGCWSNIYTFYKFPYMAYNYLFASTYAASPYAIQKLIGVYHHNSGYAIEDIDASKNTYTQSGYDGSFMDLFALPRFSSENLTTYVTGSDKSRVEKEEAFADFEAAQKFLSVCGEEYGGKDLGEKFNCSVCKKCLRTMSGFYALGKLDNFREVFDVDGYKKYLGRRLGKWFAYDHGGFVRDFKTYAKRNGVKIPFSAYLWKWCVYSPYHFLVRHLRNSKFVRKLYYKFNIDILIHGYRNSVADKFLKEEK